MYLMSTVIEQLRMIIGEYQWISGTGSEHSKSYYLASVHSAKGKPTKHNIHINIYI